MLHHPERRSEVAAQWSLPRQDAGGGLCLTDYVLPENDHVALLVTTAGGGVRERVEAFKREGEYLKSHGLAALALETAEAAAELVHQRIRAAWGFPDPPDLALRDQLAARYRGKRYSFGYPACPDLEGQVALFVALEPEEIGVDFTDCTASKDLLISFPPLFPYQLKSKRSVERHAFRGCSQDRE